MELCLYLLYALAEYISQITRSQPPAEAEAVLSTYQHLVQAVLQHNVVAYPHAAVVTQVFEGASVDMPDATARGLSGWGFDGSWCAVLGRNPKHLATDDCVVPLLQAFLGPAGVLSDTPKIRSRCA